MSKKKISIIIILFMILCGSFFITDSIRCKNDKTPIFCIEVSRYDDGGSIKHVGLFYNYYSLKVLNPEKTEDNDAPEYLTDKVITPWFFSIKYAKKKAFNYSE